MVLLLQKAKEDNFCIEINYQKNSNPAAIFQSMSELVSTLQDFDIEVAKAISVKIEPRLVLEQVESSSVRAWFATQLKEIDDEALEKLDYKAIIGKLLIKSKYWLLNLLEEKDGLDQKKIKFIQEKLNELIQESQIKRLPAYGTIPQQTIVQTYIKTARSVSNLAENDNVSFTCKYGEIRLERKTHMSEEVLEELLVAKKDISEADVCLKIKKPDYLGESRWMFYLDKHPIEAKIEDQTWLDSFRKRQVVLKPGDSLKVRLKTEIRFDDQGNPLPTIYIVIKVHEKIEGGDTNQPILFD